MLCKVIEEYVIKYLVMVETKEYINPIFSIWESEVNKNVVVTSY